MKLTNIIDLSASLEGIASLLSRWSLAAHHWSVLDGAAIKLFHHEFDSSPWRDHLNIYVCEQALPWATTELELTIPPLGSVELHDLLEVARSGIHLHLVPASRYYHASFERKHFWLTSDRRIEVATIRGCSQVWSYKSVELLTSCADYLGDLERIVHERLIRLEAALTVAKDDDVRRRLLLLCRGYQALSNQGTAEARELFHSAAGPAWGQPLT
jgi:hypothetical protein